MSALSSQSEKGDGDNVQSQPVMNGVTLKMGLEGLTGFDFSRRKLWYQ